MREFCSPFHPFTLPALKMLQVSHLSKSYGVQTILDDVSFILNRGERAGLVGPNGAGKTTLVRIIAGLEPPDAGRVTLAPNATLGYLPQGLMTPVGASGLPDAPTETLGALIRSGIAEWETARRDMDAQAAALAHGASEDQLAAYADAVTRFEARGGYEVEPRLERIQYGLGLGDIPQDTPLARLSGGQRTRVGLARLLVSEPSVLLLDEPTNHLDVAALEWLEGFVQNYAGAALIVSHDRVFLDHTVSHILELDPDTHQVTVYHGDYSAYQQSKERELEQWWNDWQAQQDELARLEGAAEHLRGIARFRKGGKADTNDKFAKGFFGNRSKETVARAKQIERRIETLLTRDKIDKPKAGYQLKLNLSEMPRSGQVVMTLEEVGHAFEMDDASPSFLFRHVYQVLRHGERIALVGPNGSGKTTLLRIMVGQVAPTEGTVQLGANVRIGYMPQEQETLDATVTPLALVRSLAPLDETDARHLLHQFLFQGDQVFTPIGSLSYGERARLILARLVVERANVLVLDEPINHLDIPSRERFEAALDAFPGTILVAAHDRAFIQRFATALWSVEGKGVRRIEK